MVDLNAGIEQFPDVLYKTTHTIFGIATTLKPGNIREHERKYRDRYFYSNIQ